jgi:hypothetical protein
VEGKLRRELKFVRSRLLAGGMINSFPFPSSREVFVRVRVIRDINL